MPSTEKVEEARQALQGEYHVRDDALPMFLRVIRKLTDEQIERALQRIAEEHESRFAPSPAEFRNYAIGARARGTSQGAGQQDWPEDQWQTRTEYAQYNRSWGTLPYEYIYHPHMHNRHRPPPNAPTEPLHDKAVRQAQTQDRRHAEKTIRDYQKRAANDDE